MIEQTRMVFERRKAHGGSVREVVLDGVGHGPIVERPEVVAGLLIEQAAGRLQPTS
jgi:pimeloyl-ACP methyl ester carboxylesterase